jgi:hypothetical protein
MINILKDWSVSIILILIVIIIGLVVLLSSNGVIGFGAGESKCFASKYDFEQGTWNCVAWNQDDVDNLIIKEEDSCNGEPYWIEASPPNSENLGKYQLCAVMSDYDLLKTYGDDHPLNPLILQANFIDDKPKGNNVLSVADIQKVVDTTIAGERKNQKSVEELIVENVQAALDDSEEREVIIEQCDAQAREQYRNTKSTEQQIREAFQECLTEAGVEDAEYIQATTEDDVFEEVMQNAARDRISNSFRECSALAIKRGQNPDEARRECLHQLQRDYEQNAGGGAGDGRVIEDSDILVDQAEELAEEEVPIDGTTEERIAALEERVRALTELVRDLTQALHFR